METNQTLDILSDPFTVDFIRIKARQLCRRTDFSRSDYEDLEQSMRLYLLEKAHLFDSARGNLEAFVTKAINTWMAMELRYRQRHKRCSSLKVVSLERTPVLCDADVTALGLILLQEDGRRLTQANPKTPFEQLELREAVEHAMQQLSPEDRAIFAHVAEHGPTSAARAFGMPRRQIQNIIDQVRVFFKNAGLEND